jgi:hypothetical protein
MTPDLATRLRRDVAIHRGAQLLADAVLCQRGEKPRLLSLLLPADAEWFKQTARNVIEAFERETTGVDVAAARDAAARALLESERQRAAIRGRIDEARQRARVATQERGHDIGTWRALSEKDGHEAAYCQRCNRQVQIDIDPLIIAGAALHEGCLSDAGETRPDPFLAHQHAADLDARRI